MTAEPSPPDGPIEVELRYAVEDPTALRAALDAALPDEIQAGPWRTVTVRDRYVDTADGRIAEAGYGARLRRVDGQVLVTVKGDVPVGPVDGGSARRRRRSRAVHERLELEAQATDSLAPADWPESAARSLIEQLAAGAPLLARFDVRQRRRECGLTSGASTATLSLDDVRVVHRRRVLDRFHALEVEADGGGPADGDGSAILEHLAAAIEATGLVTLERRTKEQIAGSIVAAHLPPGPSRSLPVPKSPGVSPDDTLGEAGRKVLGMHLARMLAREGGTRAGVDPDELKGMRVATRRMRAAWRVFEGAYRPRMAKRYVRELREVAAALGDVRDLDVQIDGLTVYIEALDEGPATAMQPLRDEWQRRREGARRRLAALLDSGAYGRFVDDYMAFVGTPGMGVASIDEHEPVRVRDTAAGRIWQAYERVRAYDAMLRWADVPALHALRIEGKRLRYALEFFREALPPRIDAVIARVTAMQDHLGALNDADVAATLTREWLVGAAGQLPEPSREAIGGYLVSREREIARLRRSFGPVWRGVSGLPLRRMLAQSLSEL